MLFRDGRGIRVVMLGTLLCRVMVSFVWLFLREEAGLPESRDGNFSVGESCSAILDVLLGWMEVDSVYRWCKIGTLSLGPSIS